MQESKSLLLLVGCVPGNRMYRREDHREAVASQGVLQQARQLRVTVGDVRQP